MKTWAVAILGLCAVCAGQKAATAPVTPAAATVSTGLTDLRTVRAIPNREAAERKPVQFEATVTYYRDYDTDLFVQDGDAAMYVAYRAGDVLRPGDRVLIRGKMQESFRPIVVADEVKLLRHGALPPPVAVTARELYSAQRDCLLARVSGTVRSAQMVWSAGRRNIYIQVLIDGGYVDAAVNSDDEGAVRRLLDAQIEMTGIVTSEFDQKMQQSGARFDVQSLEDIRILKPASSRIEDLPVTPMEDVLAGYHMRDLSQRVQVKGTITFYQPRRAVVLQSGAQSLWIVTQTDVPLKIGDVAYASGFPTVRNGYLTLERAEVRDTGQWSPAEARPLSWKEVGFGEYAFILVSTEGELVSEAREAAQDEYVFTSHGRLFSGIYRHPRGMSDADLPPMKHIEPGSQVRVYGINMFYSSDPFDGPVESNLLLRNVDDLTVSAGPSLVSKRNLEILAGVLLLAVLGFAAHGWFLERKMRRHVAAAALRTEEEAEIERRRSRILEKINRTGPLDEILEMVADLASFRLGGAACWCETREGEVFGKRSDGGSGKVWSEELSAGSGTSLGKICAAVRTGTEQNLFEQAALWQGASLASLAIETRRLYSDLVRRSEIDILTEAHSRYYLERELDILIHLSEGTGGVFGMIYFDLDGFKQVNDSFGHRIGDEYLQKVAQRIKVQLRSQDKLARMGGDEFAVLVPLIRSRGDLAEIIGRLQAALGEPFELEGIVMRASASFGMAAYPEDGSTREQLLDIADAAMYSSKMAKRI